MKENHIIFTHSWVINEYLQSVNQPPIMRRIDRLMVGDQIDEFSLANTAKREFVNTLDRCGALFRISEFPMDKYVEMRGRYILTIWRIIEKEVIRFRERTAMPSYAKSLEWWAEQISIFCESSTDNVYKSKDRFKK